MLASQQATLLFQPVAVENSSSINSSALTILNNLSQGIRTVFVEDTEALFLFQRIYVTMQCSNSVLLYDSFCIGCPDQ